VGSTFDFTSFDVEGTAIAFHFQLKTATREWRFTEMVEVPATLDPAAVGPLARLYHLASGLSYYKTLPAQTLTSGYPLRPNEITMLRALIVDGLAEFAYVNDAEWALAPTFDFAFDDTTPPPIRRNDGAPLVPVGGGKDSALSLDLLQTGGYRPIAFSVGHHPSITATAATAGTPLATATRTLDPALAEATHVTGYNGHVPVTAMNSLLAMIVAQALGAGPVIMSNEDSASEATLIWNGRAVNHQYSKSGEFETLLRDALATAGFDRDSYFSLLRPISEIAIAKRFAKLTPYHRAFTSCNRAYVRDPARRVARWCGECAKCAFVGLILSPFLARSELTGVLGFDVMTSPAITTHLPALVGLSGFKPLECVGSVAEAATALAMTAARFELPDGPRAVLAAIQPPSPGEQAALFEVGSLDSLPARFRPLLTT